MSFWSRKDSVRTIAMLVGITTCGVIVLVSVIQFSVEYLIGSPDVRVITEPPHFTVSLPPDTLTTSVWGVFDVQTGYVIAGNLVDEPKAIASVTKLFTGAAVLEYEARNTPIRITSEDIAAEGRAGKLELGATTTPYALLFPLLLESSNDAGSAIARNLGETFDTTIDSILEDVALEHTHIVEPTGLSANNTSTVSDLARYYAYLKREHPHVLDITQLRSYVTQKTGYVNNDPARSFDTFAGGKHGYTPEAGKTFVGSFRIEGEHEVGIVLLDSADIQRDVAALLAHTTRK